MMTCGIYYKAAYILARRDYAFAFYRVKHRAVRVNQFLSFYIHIMAGVRIDFFSRGVKQSVNSWIAVEGMIASRAEAP